MKNENKNNKKIKKIIVKNHHHGHSIVDFKLTQVSRQSFSILYIFP